VKLSFAGKSVETAMSSNSFLRSNISPFFQNRHATAAILRASVSRAIVTERSKILRRFLKGGGMPVSAQALPGTEGATQPFWVARQPFHMDFSPMEN